MQGINNSPSVNQSYTYEIFLGSGQLDSLAWHDFLYKIGKYLGRRFSWQLVVNIKYNTFHFYLITPKALPIDLGSGNFILKTTKHLRLTTDSQPMMSKLLWNRLEANLIEIQHKLAKRNLDLLELNLTFYLSKKDLHGVARVVAQSCDQALHDFRLSLFTPANLLSINFDQNKSLSFKKIPKYLKLDKLFDSINQKEENALLKVDTFPYAENDFYLHLSDYDFAKHSLILGSSGAGKSKLISLLIHDVFKQSPEKYKVVVIDPHDNLKHDLSDIASQSVLDFRTIESSVNLFKTTSQDLSASVELTLNLFQNLLGRNYNGQVARVLRFSTYLLLAQDQLSFLSLRKLLTDLEFRMQTVSKMEGVVPISVTRFFLTDYNEIKNQFYKDAIAPIITFIDEMQMVPVFNQEAKIDTLDDVLSKNFLSVFSLNRLNLGNTVAQTIAGLLMQQLFLLVQAQKHPQHLIIVIDEIAAIENPILARFLSELRKYHTSVILAGQYFSQISENLRASILSNTANFYIFRVSKSDATLVVQNLEMKLVGEKSKDDEVDLLTHLENRECIARISKDGKLLPALRAKTVDCPDLERIENNPTETKHSAIDAMARQFSFSVDTAPNVHDIMKANSTNRKKLP